MRIAATLTLPCLMFMFLAGCESQAVRGMKRDVEGLQRGMESLWRGAGEAEYSAGLRNYENGNYAEAYRNLQTALNKGLNWDADRVQAYKYLAFIDCASGRERACRDNFSRALAIDPSLELTTAEAGHPAWGPAFRSVKSSR